MPFIYDDSELINQLLRSALDFDFKFTKRGQAATAVGNQNRAALLGHLKDLQDQLNPAGKDPSAGPTVSHEGEAGARAAIGSLQLESLGDLIKWLATSKITVDGKRVAFDTDPQDESYTLYQLETHTATQQDCGQAPGRFYVNPELLQKYLVSLQAYEAQHPNLPMQVQLQARIQDANQELGLNINSNYKIPEKALPDNAVLDNLPKILNTAGTYVNGPAALTYGDVKTPENFNAWLSNQGISLWDEKNQRKISFDQKDFSIPDVIKIISDRAKFLASRATPETKESRDIYARQMTQLESTVGNAPGAGTATNQSTTSPGGSAQQNAGIGGSQSLQEAVQTLPFASRDINFDRIRAFFSRISQLMGNDPRVTRLINDTTQLMNSINSRMAVGDIFPMGVSPSQFAARFKNQQTPGSDYYGILKDLSQVINNTRMIVEFFWYQYAQKLTNERSYLVGQIGETPQDDSLYNQNAESLQDLYNAKHT